jgi:hypothetical protein
MAKGFDTQLQDIAVKKNKSWRPKVLLIKKQKNVVRCFSFVKGHIRKAKPVKGSKYGTDIFKAQAGVDLPKLQIRFK